jgi:hypothetical protein
MYVMYQYNTCIVSNIILLFDPQYDNGINYLLILFLNYLKLPMFNMLKNVVK